MIHLLATVLTKTITILSNILSVFQVFKLRRFTSNMDFSVAEDSPTAISLNSSDLIDLWLPKS